MAKWKVAICLDEGVSVEVEAEDEVGALKESIYHSGGTWWNRVSQEIQAKCSSQGFLHTRRNIDRRRIMPPSIVILIVVWLALFGLAILLGYTASNGGK